MAESDPVRGRFRRSSLCGEGSCVEVAALPGGEIIVRDSKDSRPHAPRLSFTAAEWDAFIAGVMAGEFTRSALVAGR
jgi:predicted secreted Zn-dependent protease